MKHFNTVGEITEALREVLGETTLNMLISDIAQASKKSFYDYVSELALRQREPLFVFRCLLCEPWLQKWSHPYRLWFNYCCEREEVTDEVL